MLLLTEIHSDFLNEKSKKNVCEIAVAGGNQIDLLTMKGELVSSVGHSLSHGAALTYDSVHSDLYIGETSEKNVSVFRIHVTKDGKSGPLLPVVFKSTKFVQSLVHDPVTSSLFWTTGIERSIMKANLNENKTELAIGTILHKFSEEFPYGIAVDSCKGTLYWTNCNVKKPSIERSLLDGNNRETLVSTRLFRPVAVAISQAERLMYWIDEKTGNLYTVERCDLDGLNRQTIVYSEGQQPQSLAVTSNKLFWTDDLHNSVWYVTHSGPELFTPIVDSVRLKKYATNHAVAGIVTSSQDQLLDENTCRNMIDLSTKVSSVVNVTDGTCLHGLATQTGNCLCAAGFTGIHCETSLCHNFCINGGECFLDNSSSPICKCPRPFTGPRCQIDLCPVGRCLNGGYCLVIASGTNSECECSDNFYGDRCQLPSVVCKHYCYKVAGSKELDHSFFRQCRCAINIADIPAPKDNATTLQLINRSSIGGNKKWPVWTLGVSCLILLSVCLILSVVVYRLKGRPRLIRRYQVNPNTVKTARRSAPADCEIAIENCCNMNICETPCYEPEFRTPGKSSKNKKEEKRGLLPNMEVQPPENTNDMF